MIDLCRDSEEPVVVPPAKRSRFVGESAAGTLTEQNIHPHVKEDMAAFKDEWTNEIEGVPDNNGGRAKVKDEMEEEKEVVAEDEDEAQQQDVEGEGASDDKHLLLVTWNAPFLMPASGANKHKLATTVDILHEELGRCPDIIALHV